MEYVIGWVACSLIGAAIGTAKDRTVEGFLLGLLLGPLGLIVVLLLPSTPRAAARRQIQIERALERERARQARRQPWEQDRPSPASPRVHPPTQLHLTNDAVICPECGTGFKAVRGHPTTRCPTCRKPVAAP